jgi:hypothetical protein
MRKGLVAGIVCFGLLSGCVSEERAAQMRADAAADREQELFSYTKKCTLEYGHIEGTPALAQCTQQLDAENKRLRREGMQALGQALSSMAPSTTTCNTTYGGGYARTNCY